MADFDLHVTGLSELEAALRLAETATPERARKIVAKGALNIKKDWARRWGGIAHAPALPRAISYDTTSSAAEASAEIGPDKGRRQGALGNIIEFGTSKNAPIPGGLPALAAEEPKFVAAMQDLAEEALGG